MSKGSKNVVKGSKGRNGKGRAIVTSPATRNDGKQGRVIGKIIETTHPDVLKREIEGLKNELRASLDRNDKKRIRRMLRTRGHFGGLGIRATRVAS